MRASRYALIPTPAPSVPFILHTFQLLSSSNHLHQLTRFTYSNILATLTLLHQSTNVTVQCRLQKALAETHHHNPAPVSTTSHTHTNVRYGYELAVHEC